jgi:hypothetical protein
MQPSASRIADLYLAGKTARGRSKRTSLKAELKLKDGTVYARGTAAEVVFSERTPFVSEVIIEGRTIRVATKRLNRYFKGFTKEPSLRTLEKWMSDGLGSTITGKRGIELDGYGSDGAPSWYLALGLI